jgi:hypothetical protein
LLETKRKCAWKCNVCYTRYETGTLSIYCGQCDFDICKNCFEMSLDTPEKMYIYKLTKFFISVHEHNLTFKMPHGGWSCDVCKASYPYRSYSYRCDTCNWDQCFKCRFKK